MKRNAFLIPVLWSSTALLVSPVWADSFGSNQVGGSLTSTITMTVGIPTCSLDDSAQTVNFTDVSVSELRAASRKLPAGIKLSCDSIPSGIRLTFSPVGGATIDNIARPGVVSGTLTGTGYKLTWADGSAVGIKDNTIQYNTPLTMVPTTAVTDIRLNVTPVATSAGSISSGESQAMVNIALTYT